MCIVHKPTGSNAVPAAKMILQSLGTGPAQVKENGGDIIITRAMRHGGQCIAHAISVTMSQALPTLDLEALPPELRAAVEANVGALATQATELDAERAARAHLEAEMQELAAHNERLEHLVRELQRARFGRKSEKLNADQLVLTFEDLEIAIGEAQEAHDRTSSTEPRPKPKRTKAGSPRALPKDLPRVETV